MSDSSQLDFIRYLANIEHSLEQPRKRNYIHRYSGSIDPTPLSSSPSKVQLVLPEIFKPKLASKQVKQPDAEFLKFKMSLLQDNYMSDGMKRRLVQKYY